MRRPLSEVCRLYICYDARRPFWVLKLCHLLITERGSAVKGTILVALLVNLLYATKVYIVLSIWSNTWRVSMCLRCATNCLCCLKWTCTRKIKVGKLSRCLGFAMWLDGAEVIFQSWWWKSFSSITDLLHRICTNTEILASKNNPCMC